MKRFLLAGATALGFIGYAYAQNREHTILRTQAWHVYATMGSLGRPLCSAVTQADTRAFYIKYSHGQPGLEFQVTRRTWNLSRGQSVPMRMWVDGQSGWTFEARVADGQNNMLVWFATGETVDAFERAFRYGGSLYISFPNNRADEPEPWSVALGGSNNIMGAFVRCMDLLNELVGGSVRPPNSPSPEPAAPSLFGTGGRRT